MTKYISISESIDLDIDLSDYWGIIKEWILSDSYLRADLGLPEIDDVRIKQNLLKVPNDLIWVNISKGNLSKIKKSINPGEKRKDICNINIEYSINELGQYIIDGLVATNGHVLFIYYFSKEVLDTPRYNMSIIPFLVDNVDDDIKIALSAEGLYYKTKDGINLSPKVDFSYPKWRSVLDFKEAVFSKYKVPIIKEGARKVKFINANFDSQNLLLFKDLITSGECYQKDEDSPLFIMNKYSLAIVISIP